MRVHSRFTCSVDVLYANAEVSLRFCGQTPLAAEACPVLDTDANSAPLPKAGRTYDNFTTSDSDPHPESGYYVATAVYEVCLLNGGAFPGTGKSAHVYYNASTGKVDRAIQELDLDRRRP